MNISLILFFLLGCTRGFTQEIYEHPLNQIEGRNCNVSICCVFQNEKEWLKEWIEFHKLVGVDHFYLYNNLSTDEYLEILTPYLLIGEVELFDYPKKPFTVADQKVIYNHALELSRGHGQWIAAIDTDEFIVPLETKHLCPYLDHFSDNIGSVEINWVTFGTSRVKRLKKGELMIERLILRAPVDASVNVWTKTIARCSATIGWDNAHTCSLKKGFENFKAISCDVNGIPENESAIAQIRIHHYIWRTEDFFNKVKVPRIKNWDINLFQCSSPFDYIPVTNSVLDPTMLEFVPRLKESL